MPDAVLQPAPVSAKTRRCLATHRCSRSSPGSDVPIVAIVPQVAAGRTVAGC